MSTITTCYKGDMLFRMKIGNHTLNIDVPPAMGGKDRGPMPPPLFIASLGSCLAPLVADYCSHREMDARDMAVDVSLEKTEHPTRLTGIRVTVTLPHADCSEQRCRDALLRVAEHCPVHQTIETVQGVKFDIVGGKG